MVPQLRNVLRLLKFSGISIPDFESRMNLSPGSMQKFLEEKKGIELPIAVMNFDYHTLLDMLTEEKYSHENTSSTDLLVFRVRNNFKEGKSTTIYIDPKDGHNEHVFWTVG